MTDDDAIRNSLAALEPQAMEAASEVIHLRMALHFAQTRATELAKIVDSLHNLLKASDDPATVDSGFADTESKEESEDQLAASQFGVVTEKPNPVRVRSTKLVVEIVDSVGPDGNITRDEVLEQMNQRGHTLGMKDARNSINTALYRAVNQKRIRQVGPDAFASLTQTAPVADEPDNRGSAMAIDLGGGHA